jgi:CubicO group peptidase (beta-lactamase class C family)
MKRRTFLAAGAASLAIGVAPCARAQSQALRNAAAYSAARRGVSLYVAQRGQMLFQDYPNEGGADRGWELASGTKSFTGVMAAAAIQDRLISSWDEPASETLREWRNDERRRITIRHLLSLTSGIGGRQTIRPPSYEDAVALPVETEPGARFQYSPAPFQIFGEIIKRKTGSDPVAYLQRRVLDHLQIRATEWRRGRDGNPLMPQGAAFKAGDWARFGWFVMREGEGLVDRAALAQCFIASRANPGYGLSWWLLRDGLIPPGARSGIEIDTAMSEQFGVIRMAAGAGDQRLYLVPDLDLVIARQASHILQAYTRRGGARWSDAEFLRAILAE